MKTLISPFIFRPLSVAVLGSLLLLAFTFVSSAPAQINTKPDDPTIADAYVYLLGRALVVRQEKTDRKGDGFAFNAIKYNPLGSAQFVNPNFDVAYLEAWIAVDDKTPAVLEIPKVEGRYYTAQVLDEWGEVIVNINERTFPSQPYGKFALVAPGSTAAIPEGAARIELHSKKAKLLGRVELKTDPDGAVALQKAFKLSSQGTPAIADPPQLADFSNKDLIGAEIFDGVGTILASALDVSPIAAEMQQKVRAVASYVSSGSAARAEVDKLIHENVVPGFLEYAFTKSAPYRNHWVGGGQTGNYGKDYWLRTTVNYAGIWANETDEAIYFIATKDAEEKPLNGSNSYVIHFPADGLPQSAIDSYWSVILVGVPDYMVVSNPLNRFNFNTYSDLKSEADGSLKLGIGPKPVAGVPESNWLPAPEAKSFSLTFRTYVPKDVVKDGKWAPPAVMKVN
jgi:hypothetical protein